MGSQINRNLSPVWNENFEFQGTLKELLAHTLEVQVYSAAQATSRAQADNIGKASFDLSEVQAADFEGSSALSVQGTVTLKISWAPVNVVKTGEMFFKHKGDAFFSSTMGKYLRHDFRLLCAENNGEGGSTAWKSYRLVYKDKSGTDNYHTVIGVGEEAAARYEYTVNTLEGSIMMMRVVDSTTYNEWTTLLKSIEDPNLKGPNLKIAKEGGSSPRLLSSSRLLAKEGSSP